MSDIDSIIEKCIDDIWKTYDKDNSGFLDKQETKVFVKNTLSEMGESAEFAEQDFEACFKEFDKDGNGTISKDEMKIFIKKVAGLWALTSVLCIEPANLISQALNVTLSLSSLTSRSYLYTSILLLIY